jgi:vacuolar-type H+-ATPase subunit F/Vma7
VRERFKELEKDIEVLDEHEAELAQKFRNIVCKSENVDLITILDDIQQDVREHRERVENTDKDD